MSVMAAGRRGNEIEELSGALMDWALVIGVAVLVGLLVHVVLRGACQESAKFPEADH